jgi:hypothetical protein
MVAGGNRPAVTETGSLKNERALSRFGLARRLTGIGPRIIIPTRVELLQWDEGA